MKKGRVISSLIIAIFLILAIISFFALNSLNKIYTEDDKKYCTEDQRNVEVCVNLYDPVCAHHNNGTVLSTFPNSCVACLNEKTIYYLSGECNEKS